MEDLVNYLMQCNLTQNDATVYLCLLKHKLSDPSRIAKETGIQRPRVYDSLKRLLERGYIVQEMKKKRPQYAISSSQLLLTELQNQISYKKEASEMIQEYIIDQLRPSTERGIFFYNKKEVLCLKLQNFMQSSQRKITIMAIFPLSLSNEPLLDPELLGNKSLEGQEVTLLLNVNEKNWEYCLDLHTKKVKIYHYPLVERVPTFIHLIDDKALFLSVFKQQDNKIKLEYGISFSGERNLIMVFNFLIEGFIKQSIPLAERFEELKKSIIFPINALKELYGL